MGTETITLADLSKAKTKEGTAGELAPVRQETEVTAFSVEEQQRIEEIKSEIDFMNAQTTVQYGVSAQRKMTEFADSVLTSVKSKDGGEVGDLLSELVITVKGIDADSGSESLLQKMPLLKNAAHSIKKLKERYTKAEVQINRIESALEKARIGMLKDIGVFDIMYQENLTCFRELGLYIEAGKEKVAEMQNETIPKLQAEAEASGDPMDAQLVRDFADTVDRFEKKIYDLELSRTIAIQSAPQIKLIQNNDRILVDKIQTAILNTIPVWKSQFVIAMGLSNQQKVLKLQHEVNDATNQMLLRNSELLKTNTTQTAAEANRGIADIETLQKVNENLINTIEETIKIQKEGKEKRQAAEAELGRIENELKQKLLEVSK